MKRFQLFVTTVRAQLTPNRFMVSRNEHLCGSTCNSSDAARAIAVVRASIVELCVDDHKNDPATLARWLQNKTPEMFATWINDPRNCVFVGVVDSQLCGVGLLEQRGNLRLCYVHPSHQRRGIGGTIVAELEAQARHWKLREIRLTSSANARRFYEHHGYVSTGEAIHEFGVLWDYPYRKQLSDPGAGDDRVAGALFLARS